MSLIRGCKMKRGFIWIFFQKTTLPLTLMATKPSFGGYLSLMHVKVATTFSLMWFRFTFVFCHLANSIYYLINFTFNNGYWLSRFRLCNEQFIKLFFKKLSSFKLMHLLTLLSFGDWVLKGLSWNDLEGGLPLMKFFSLNLQILCLSLPYIKHTNYDVKQLTWGLYIQNTIFVNCKYVYDFDHFIFYRVVYIFMWFITRSCHVCFYLLWVWKCTLKFRLSSESSQLPWSLGLQLIIYFSWFQTFYFWRSPLPISNSIPSSHVKIKAPTQDWIYVYLHKWEP